MRIRGHEEIVYRAVLNGELEVINDGEWQENRSNMVPSGSLAEKIAAAEKAGAAPPPTVNLGFREE